MRRHASGLAFAPGVLQVLCLLGEGCFFLGVCFLLRLMVQEGGFLQFALGVVAYGFCRRFAEFCGDGYLRMDVRSDFVFVKDGLKSLAAVLFAVRFSVELREGFLRGLAGFSLLGLFVSDFQLARADAAGGGAVGACFVAACAHAAFRFAVCCLRLCWGVLPFVCWACIVGVIAFAGGFA